MRDAGVEVPESIFYSEVPVLLPADEQTYRLGNDIEPRTSESYVERCLAFYDGSFKLKPAVKQAYGKQSVIFVEVSLPCPHIHYRRKPPAISCREAAFIEVH